MCLKYIYGNILLVCLNQWCMSRHQLQFLLDFDGLFSHKGEEEVVYFSFLPQKEITPLPLLQTHSSSHTPTHQKT